MRDFRKFEVWKKSHDLVKEIYLNSKGFPITEKYGFTSQICRAAISIPTSFAEGCGRGSDADFVRFLQISLGSISEVDYLIILAKDLNFIDLETELKLHEKLEIIRKMTFKLIKTIRDRRKGE